MENVDWVGIYEQLVPIVEDRRWTAELSWILLLYIPGVSGLVLGALGLYRHFAGYFMDAAKSFFLSFGGALLVIWLFLYAGYYFLAKPQYRDMFTPEQTVYYARVTVSDRAEEEEWEELSFTVAEARFLSEFGRGADFTGEFADGLTVGRETGRAHFMGHVFRHYFKTLRKGDTRTLVILPYDDIVGEIRDGQLVLPQE